MRQMASPSPMPWGFVVMNASKMFGSRRGSIPGPQSSTVNDDRIVGVARGIAPATGGGRRSSAAMASMALRTRLMKTSCNWPLVAHNQRQFRRQLGLRRDGVILQLLAQGVCSTPSSQLIHVDRLVGLVGLAERGADIVEHLAGAMGVADHPVQRQSTGLFEVRRRVAEKSQRRAAVRGDAGQRLAHLVADRSRHRFHVHELVVALALQFGDRAAELVGAPAQLVEQPGIFHRDRGLGGKARNSSTCLSEKGRTSWR